MAHETISDDLFGSLTWDDERHEWQGRAVTARGLAFRLWIDTGVWDMVHPIDDTKVDRTISSASRQAFVRVRDSEQRAREGLVSEFVPLHADWHGEQISAADFQARLELDSVQFLRDGGVEIFYGDDGMFGGHSLIVHLDSSGEFERGEMFG
jgi:hypothetical protein